MNDKALVAAYGEQFYDAAATIYVNFYVSELQIIDLCGKWIPRRTRLREKFFLVHHAADEIRQLFRGIKQILITLPLTWSNESAIVGAPHALGVVHGLRMGGEAPESR